MRVVGPHWIPGDVCTESESSSLRALESSTNINNAEWNTVAISITTGPLKVCVGLLDSWCYLEPNGPTFLRAILCSKGETAAFRDGAAVFTLHHSIGH